ncbi:MAG: damage-inducible protein CinA [Sulfobacillus acidophilus]|uniref:Putative competence-damage inducible protein n=1 Tax=Sulfobacillus acidophilus TaxID=53633 RepID=A0A2T2WNI8_9FIRM|nr:MAG: damage-inducible protein CinA [Sulfobacillus acidophilus]
MIRTAHIIAVGDELVWGETVNSNGAWIADFLRESGVRTVYQCMVPDEDAAIGSSVASALAAADVAIVMGGLGPTADDRTVDAVSAYLGRNVHTDPDVQARISAHHGHASGWEASVRRQSRIIDGALVWINPRGQAPGQCLEVNGRYVVLLPGPPREMQGICEVWMRPWLHQHAQGGVRRDTLSVFDLGESAVAAHLWPLLEGDHPHCGIYAQPGRVDIRIETDASPEGQILAERARIWVINHLPVPVFELGQTSREAFLVQWLTDQHMTLAAMESLTGGMVLSALIGVAGASQAILGGLIAYTDWEKIRFGVSEQTIASAGAVSEACALEMADAARRQFGSTVGVASTGFAGPGGGSADNPVGTFYVAAVMPQGQLVRRRYAPLERQAVRQIATHTALSVAWELLKLPTLLKNIESD